jgi:hypothetical protein
MLRRKPQRQRKRANKIHAKRAVSCSEKRQNDGCFQGTMPQRIHFLQRSPEGGGLTARLMGNIGFFIRPESHLGRCKGLERSGILGNF